MRRRRIRLSILLALVAALLACALATPWLLPAPAMSLRSASRPSITICDRNGTVLYEITDPHGGSQRNVPLEEIPLNLRQAVIATEDAGFYYNPGISLPGIARAAVQNLKAGAIVSGGSTITQGGLAGHSPDGHDVQGRNPGLVPE